MILCATCGKEIKTTYIPTVCPVCGAWLQQVNLMDNKNTYDNQGEE